MAESVMDGYLTIRNIGIKMCQLKCIEHGACLNFEYNIETLTCRLSRDEPKKTDKNEGYISLLKNHSNVPGRACASRTCNIGLRCLETRSGKAVCVRGGKLNYPEVSPTPNSDNQDTEDKSLHDACRKGDLGRVRCILSQSVVDVNSREKTEGMTPIMVAAQTGRVQIFDLLIKKGANSSLVDDYGNNILHLACMTGNVDMVTHVVNRTSLDINSRSESGRTPLMNAAYTGHKNVFGFLVSRGANVSQVDNSGRSILYWVKKGGNTEMEEYVLKCLPE